MLCSWRRVDEGVRYATAPTEADRIGHAFIFNAACSFVVSALSLHSLLIRGRACHGLNSERVRSTRGLSHQKLPPKLTVVDVSYVESNIGAPRPRDRPTTDPPRRGAETGSAVPRPPPPARPARAAPRPTPPHGRAPSGACAASVSPPPGAAIPRCRAAAVPAPGAPPTAHIWRISHPGTSA